MDDPNQSEDMRGEIERYRAIVLQYEALDEQIDSLIMAHGGTSEKMPAPDLQKYRDLARERDDLFSEMRALEQTLGLNADG